MFRKQRPGILFTLIIVLFLSACGSAPSNNDNTGPNSSPSGEATGDENTSNGSTDGEAESAEYPNAHLLADADWIAEHLEDEQVVFIDARSKGYEEGHIPGAVNLSSGKINDPDNETDGFLLPEEAFSETVSNLGINQDSTVVIYDDGNALSATRIFYALEYYGLQDQVKVLNGGYAAWLTAGHDVSFDAPEVTPGNFVAKANEQLVSTKEDVTESLDSDNVVVLDTRSEGEYTGTDLRNNKHGGHIPGAVHQEWTDTLVESETGLQQFMSYPELKAKFEQIGVVEDKTVIPYCQTNVRGAHTYFSLRLLGYSDIKPYEGSWAEWGNSDDTPIES